jgi:nucleotide-binding universal stress UspA family protein
MKTNNVKKILIALDYNPTAKKVAEDGYAMAKTMGAEVILLHVVIDLAMYSSIYPTMGIWQINENGVVDLYENANKSAHEFLDKAKHHLGDASIRTFLKEGDAAQMILNISSEMKVDCIVMGSHSQKWLENIVMGSVTEEVLRKTNIPLFIIPTKKTD